jgi:predicted metal-dependent hydrolase
MSFKSAERFIEEKESWLRKNLVKINNTEKSFTVFDFETVFHTNEHSLKIVRTENEKPGVKIHDSEIQVFCPIKKNIKDKEIQQMIRWGIETAWRKEASKYIPVRLGELAMTNGFEFSRISIKNNKSRWGSCSGTNNINLSLHLMRLPRHLSDYVILHELVHTVHKNHSKKFWSHLDAITGNAKALDKELKKYRIEIY